MASLVRKLLNFVLMLIKWPMALLMLYLLPGSLLEMLELLDRSELGSPQVAPFIYGFVGYSIAWVILFRRYIMG